MPHIAIVGNLSEGFTAHGPFVDFDAASQWAEGKESWVMELQNPEGRLKASVRIRLAEAEIEFEAAGRRGVALADEIDRLRKELEQ